MYQDLKKHFWWPGMKKKIAEWVSKCHWKWEEIAMDFVVGLPRTRSNHDAIWVIIDRLNKSAHFLPINEKYSLEKLVKIYLDEIVSKHGVPVSIVSDRDPRFNLRFRTKFQECLGTKLNMSTAYHPQTDGQSERTIQTIEDMLRCRSPLYWDEIGEKKVLRPELVPQTKEAVVLIRKRLEAAQNRQKKNADLHRKDIRFEIGSLVLLKVSPWKGLVRFGQKAPDPGVEAVTSEKSVIKSTKPKEGSVKEGKKGEGQGKNQRSPKNKVGEDVTIEQSFHPRAHAKRVRDTSSPQTYIRKKKPKTLGDAQGTHLVLTGAKDPVNAPSQSQVDVAPMNVDSQPKSLIIEAPDPPNSLTHSLDVDMINTSLPNSPSLTLLEKPKIQVLEHHLLDDLLAHLPFLSKTVETSVSKFSSICTESIIVSTPNSIISTIPMDIHHPSSSDCIPMDKPNSSHPSDSHTTNPMDIHHPSGASAQLQISSILTSAEDLVVMQSLLGLREGSDLSESLGCSQEKGEKTSE
ncbi:hypothetical protein AgCh_004783 [Apium graveolens]